MKVRMKRGMRHIRRITVYLECTSDRIDERKVKVLNIEEGPVGEDILTFTCPLCGKKHRSNRYS
jgi:hypothetical protein